MSYHIDLYRKEVKIKHLQATSEGEFWETESNFLLLTEAQQAYLKDRLLRCRYVEERQTAYGIELSRGGEQALLTKMGLFFSASWKTPAIFEINLKASELTDTGEFSKYDPQTGKWEAEME